MENDNADRRIFLTQIATYRDSRDEEQTKWTRCGVAFKNKNGGGFTLQFDTLPLSGRVLLQEESQEEANERRDKQNARRPASPQRRDGGRGR